MTEVKVREQKFGEFPISELAALVPMASEAEQMALTLDIDENGQRDAIILWQGEVVDGRCRQQAIMTLGNRDIKYRELSDSLTEAEVAVYVKSVNTRRNLTATQKIMSACKETLSPLNKRSVAVTAKSWGISKSILDNARYIAKHRPEYVEPLFNGGAIEIQDNKDKTITTNKITSIYAAIRKDIEDTRRVDEEHAWSADSYIKTQKGKEWFYKFLDKYEIKNVDVMKEIAVAANAHYPKNPLYNESK